MKRLLKGFSSLVVIGAVIAGVVIVIMLPGVQEKIGGGRRARGGGEGAVPVLAAPARIADMPVYLNGVGTAKARNTVTVRAAGRRPHPQPQFQGRAGRQARRRAGHDRSRHLPGAARPGGRQEGARRGAARQRPARPRALRKLGGISWRRRPSTRSARSSPSSPRRSSWTMRPSPTPRPILDYTTIVSPIDGRTGIRMVDEGNLVRAVRRRHRRHHRGPADRRALHAAAAAAGPGQRGARHGAR